MAKHNRENAVRERRARKQARKDARKQAVAVAPIESSDMLDGGESVNEIPQALADA